MSHRHLNILLLCDLSCPAATIRDHVFSIKQYSQHKIYILQIRGNLPPSIDLEKFDAIYLHYTLVICMDTYLSPSARQRLRNYQGLKAVFIQDEYRFINQTVAALQELAATVLFTVVPADTVEKIYPAEKLPGLEKITILTGYVPQNLTQISVPDYEARDIDVSYRGRVLPFWLGEFGQEKWFIGDKFKADAEKFQLRCDISSNENDRLYQKQWIKFLMSSKAVLGVESGASVCDFDAEIERKVRAHLAAYPEASFTEVQQQYFSDVDGKIVINTISPRCFEAAALRTLMILYEGSYSGILQAWRHYVPLKKDHSNMNEVIAVLQNPSQAKKIIETAYSEIALNKNYSFQTMVNEIDNLVSEKINTLGFVAKKAYSEFIFKKYSCRVIFRRLWAMIRKKLSPMYQFFVKRRIKYT